MCFCFIFRCIVIFFSRLPGSLIKSCKNSRKNGGRIYPVSLHADWSHALSVEQCLVISVGFWLNLMHSTLYFSEFSDQVLLLFLLFNSLNMGKGKKCYSFYKFHRIENNEKKREGEKPKTAHVRHKDLEAVLLSYCEYNSFHGAHTLKSLLILKSRDDFCLITLLDVTESLR